MTTKQTSKVRRSAYVDGKRIWGCGSTVKEAEARLKEKIIEAEKNTGKIDRNITVAQWADSYINDYKKPSVQYATLKVTEVIINKWVIPYLGNMHMKDVKSIHVQKMINAMTGLSKQYIKNTKMIVGNMFEKAIANDIAYANPTKHIVMPKAQDGSHRALTEAERKSFLAMCETSKHGLYGLFLYYTGCRPGETASVTVNDIDFKNMTVHLHGTKNKNADRVIPLYENLAEALKKELNGKSPFEYVFSHDGKPVSEKRRLEWWQQIRKDWHVSLGGHTVIGNSSKLQAPYMIDMKLSAYDLRHTFATRMMESGVPIDIASKIMGHADMKMLGRIYQHFTPAAMEVARELMNRSAV